VYVLALHVYISYVNTINSITLQNIYILWFMIFVSGKLQSDLMTIFKSTVRMNINTERGSATIYIKKELTEKIISMLGFATNTDLLAICDDEKGELCIREL